MNDAGAIKILNGLVHKLYKSNTTDADEISLLMVYSNPFTRLSYW